MPELPDLQAFSRNLDKKLSGKKLKEVTPVNKSRLKTPSKLLKESLEGRTLKKIYREGKELHFEFSNGGCLGFI
jgi:formamidopyrimidine-DNA glycosylase